MIPGEWLLADEPIEINEGRCKQRLSVRNAGDRPIQVGSHFHFFEVNRVLQFDRATALGMRLDVPSGQAIRFEAGDERDVELVALGGHGRVIGFNGLLDASISSAPARAHALRQAARLGFSGAEPEDRGPRSSHGAENQRSNGRE